MIFLILFSQLASASDILVMPEIIRSRSAGDILLQDSLRPTISGSTMDTLSASGSVEKVISQRTSLPTRDVGRPGNLTQVRGLGRSADDTDVRSIGVPLNPPQGGGFDFSVFPSFIWSSFSFQPGSFDGGIETRARSGQILLIPWTQQALESEQDKIRVTQVFSTLEQSQTAVGASVGGKKAALLGLSVGKSNGPSGSVSFAFGDGSLTSQFHLLATSVESKIAGSQSSPTPNTKQYNVRLIPALEIQKKFKSDQILKSTFFFDGQFNRYSSPELFVYTRDHVFQLGCENAYIVGDWKFGFGVKHIKFAQIDFKAPDETVSHLQASYQIKEAPWTWEPEFGINHVTRFGVSPAVNLGAKYQYNANLNSFARVGFSERVPSMIDRFYQSAYVKNNPDLLPEKTWTTVIGLSSKTEGLEHVLQFQGQRSQDAQITKIQSGLYVPSNAGYAYVGSLMDFISYKVASDFTVQNAVTISQSYVQKSDAPYPYLPLIQNNLGLAWSQTGDQPRWSAGTNMRAATFSTVSSRSDRVGGYALLDINSKYIFSKAFEMSAQLENIFNRHVELVKDYPLPGLAFVIAGQGNF